MIKSMKRLTLLGTLLFILTNTSGCTKSDSNDFDSIPTLITPKKFEIKSEKVTRGSIQKDSSINGNIVPAAKYDMSYKIKGGYLKKIYVKAGDIVKKGDIIAELDNTEVQASIKQQEIKVKMSQLSYDNLVKNNASELDIQRAQLTLDGDKLQLEQLTNNYKNSILTAEAAGQVTYIANTKPAQLVSTFQTLVTISDLSTFQVQCDVKNFEFVLGAKVSINMGDKKYSGEVISNTAIEQRDKPSTPNSKVLDKIIVKFTEPTGNLTLGTTVTCIYNSEHKENVLILPSAAVKNAAGGHYYVTLMQQGNMVDNFVEVGIQGNGYYEITSGLAEGDEVIIK